MKKRLSYLVQMSHTDLNIEQTSDCHPFIGYMTTANLLLLQVRQNGTVTCSADTDTTGTLW